MQDHLLIYFNGQRHEVRGSDAFQSLSDFLRYQRALTGTKIVCSEGDCGACTVLVGRVSAADAATIDYRIVNSCIQFLWQLEGAHVITVEGLRTTAGLTPIQDRMVACHASQCGFCTPGFVVSLTALCQPGEKVTEDSLRDGLTGNLCRCTGYLPILQAGTTLDCSAQTPIAELYPAGPIAADVQAHHHLSIQIRCGDRSLLIPADLKQAVAFLADQPAATIYAGGTDLGVRINKGMLPPPKALLSVGHLSELQGLSVEGDTLYAGAAASWSDLEAFAEEHLPEFHRILLLFGSPQIRNAGTIGGNIANASPIADSLPFLYVSEAELELTGPAGMRTVPIDRFYKGYKQLDLRAGELITRILLPLPSSNRVLKLYKVSKRTHLDISTFTAALSLRLTGATIIDARIAYGGVGPTVLRLPNTEAFLAGKEFTEQTFRDAAHLAVAEVTPISDVRGTKTYRSLLARNILLKFFYDHQHLTDAQPVSVN